MSQKIQLGNKRYHTGRKKYEEPRDIANKIFNTINPCMEKIIKLYRETLKISIHGVIISCS